MSILNLIFHGPWGFVVAPTVKNGPKRITAVSPLIKDHVWIIAVPDQTTGVLPVSTKTSNINSGDYSFQNEGTVSATYLDPNQRKNYAWARKTIDQFPNQRIPTFATDASTVYCTFNLPPTAMYGIHTESVANVFNNNQNLGSILSSTLAFVHVLSYNVGGNAQFAGLTIAGAPNPWTTQPHNQVHIFGQSFKDPGLMQGNDFGTMATLFGFDLTLNGPEPEPDPNEDFPAGLGLAATDTWDLIDRAQAAALIAQFSSALPDKPRFRQLLNRGRMRPFSTGNASVCGGGLTVCGCSQLQDDDSQTPCNPSDC